LVLGLTISDDLFFNLFYKICKNHLTNWKNPGIIKESGTVRFWTGVAVSTKRGQDMLESKQTKYWVYYQPNDKDLKDKFGDCTIRALTKALNLSWVDAFLKMVPYCVKYQTSNIFSLPLDLEKEVMLDLGFTYTGISNKKGTKRPTVREFAKNHPTGTYILNVAGHEVTCVDGKYYDTWDCGYCSLYGYFTKV
jgi:hypothetical protein